MKRVPSSVHLIFPSGTEFRLCPCMRKLTLTTTLIPILSAATLLLLSCGGATLRPPPAAGFKLVWSDEFNGPDRTYPDPSTRTYDTGGKGLGNNDLKCYTN